MREKPEASEWYYFKAGSNADMKAGPLSWERLRSQAEAGTVEPEDVVWDPGFGWRMATQVPGLFPEDTATKLANSGLDTSSLTKLPMERPPKVRRPWRYWLAASVALVIVAAAVGSYFGCVHDDSTPASGKQTTTTVAAPATTVATPTTTVLPTTTVAPPTTVAQSPVRVLGEADNGHEVRLNVGERIRIELEPRESSGVRAVEWEFLPLVARELDSGTEKVGDRVVKCWLELEAVTAGPLTVRAHYRYQYLTNAPWVCYFLVRD